jgi:hypothetical protein
MAPSKSALLLNLPRSGPRRERVFLTVMPLMRSSFLTIMSPSEPHGQRLVPGNVAEQGANELFDLPLANPGNSG